MCSHVYRVLLILAVVYAATTGEADSQVVTFAPDEPIADDRLQRGLSETVAFSFQGKPLADVVEQLRRQHRIPIYFDLPALDAVQVAVDTPVSLQLPNVRLGAALKCLLRPLGLDWVAEDGELKITSVEEADSFLVTRVYPVADLLTPPSAERYAEVNAEVDSLADLITDTVGLTTWSDVGGAAELTPVPDRGVIVCVQTSAIHDQIECLIAALRHARNEQFPNLQVRLPTEERKEQRAIVKLRQALAGPVTLNCNSASVREFAQQIASTCQIPVVVDSQIGDDVKVTVNLQNVHLRKALWLALDPIGLEASIYDEVLFIAPGTSESWQDSDTRVYAVWDLVLPQDGDEDSALPDRKLRRLVQTIQLCVQPTTWEEVGGPHEITPFRNAGALVISQTSFGHDEVSQLLANLRAARDKQTAAGFNQFGGPLDPPNRLERALSEQVSFDFRATPLAEAAEQIRRQCQVPVHLDRAALEAVGIAIDAPVTLKVRGNSLRSALNHLLRALDLAWMADEGVLRITTVDEAEQHLVARCYPVADLVVPLEYENYSYGGELADFDSIADLICSTVAPTSWSDRTGPPPIYAVPSAGAIVFEQTPDVHDQAASLLADLRRVRQLQYPNARYKLPVAEARDAASVLAIRKALDTVVDLQFDETPLSEALEQIADKHGIPVLLDNAALASVDLMATAPVLVELRGVTLKAGLRQVLHEFELVAVLRDEVLLVTTRDEAEQLLDLRVYPVADLIEEAGEPPLPASDSLILAIAKSILPGTWDNTGGVGSIELFPNAGALVVSHTEVVHEQIATLLADLRRARDMQPLVANPEKAPPVPDDGRMHLKVYHLSAGYGGGGFGAALMESDSDPTDTEQPIPPQSVEPPQPSSAQLAEVIRQTIEPQSWTGAGGTALIQALPDALVILQTNPAHEQIVKLLRAIGYRWIAAHGVE
jgi:hypothetical protein